MSNIYIDVYMQELGSIKEGKLIEEIIVIDNSFRHFVYELGLESYHKCNFCGALLDDYKIYNNKEEVTLCPECNSSDILISPD